MNMRDKGVMKMVNTDLDEWSVKVVANRLNTFQNLCEIEQILINHITGGDKSNIPVTNPLLKTLGKLIKEYTPPTAY